jgi:hypothetical protein
MADEQELYDVVVPPGVPRKILFDIEKKFKVKIVERPTPIKIANVDGEERNLLAFRGPLDEVQKVEKYMLDQLKAFVEEK